MEQMQLQSQEVPIGEGGEGEGGGGGGRQREEVTYREVSDVNEVSHARAQGEPEQEREREQEREQELEQVREQRTNSEECMQTQEYQDREKEERKRESNLASPFVLDVDDDSPCHDSNDRMESSDSSVSNANNSKVVEKGNSSAFPNRFALDFSSDNSEVEVESEMDEIELLENRRDRPRGPSLPSVPEMKAQSSPSETEVDLDPDLDLDLDLDFSPGDNSYRDLDSGGPLVLDDFNISDSDNDYGYGYAKHKVENESSKDGLSVVTEPENEHCYEAKHDVKENEDRNEKESKEQRYNESKSVSKLSPDENLYAHRSSSFMKVDQSNIAGASGADTNANVIAIASGADTNAIAIASGDDANVSANASANANANANGSSMNINCLWCLPSLALSSKGPKEANSPGTQGTEADQEQQGEKKGGNGCFAVLRCSRRTKHSQKQQREETQDDHQGDTTGEIKGNAKQGTTAGGFVPETELPTAPLNDSLPDICGTSSNKLNSSSSISASNSNSNSNNGNRKRFHEGIGRTAKTTFLRHISSNDNDDEEGTDELHLKDWVQNEVGLGQSNLATGKYVEYDDKKEQEKEESGNNDTAAAAAADVIGTLDEFGRQNEGGNIQSGKQLLDRKEAMNTANLGSCSIKEEEEEEEEEEDEEGGGGEQEEEEKEQKPSCAQGNSDIDNHEPNPHQDTPHKPSSNWFQGGAISALSIPSLTKVRRQLFQSGEGEVAMQGKESKADASSSSVSRPSLLLFKNPFTNVKAKSKSKTNDPKADTEKNDGQSNVANDQLLQQEQEARNLHAANDSSLQEMRLKDDDTPAPTEEKDELKAQKMNQAQAKDQSEDQTMQGRGRGRTTSSASSLLSGLRSRSRKRHTPREQQLSYTPPRQSRGQSRGNSKSPEVSRSRWQSRSPSRGRSRYRRSSRHRRRSYAGRTEQAMRVEEEERKLVLKDKYNVFSECLGKGHFSEVFAGERRRTGQPVAIKFIDRSKSRVKRLSLEVSILRTIEYHPNVIELYDVFETESHVQLVTEIVTGGELFEHLIEKGPYSEADACRHIKGIASAIAFLHSHGIAHRDLKPENILLTSWDDKEAIVKIADFGLARLIDQEHLMQTVCGTWAYSAPEVKNRSKQQEYGTKVDLWSIGVIVYIVLVGYHPFDCDGDAADDVMWYRIERGLYDFNDPAWNSVSLVAQDLIKKLLVVNPEERLDAQELLNHPWLSNSINLNTLQNRSDQVGLASQSGQPAPGSLCSTAAEGAIQLSEAPLSPHIDKDLLKVWNRDKNTPRGRQFSPTRPSVAAAAAAVAATRHRAREYDAATSTKSVFEEAKLEPVDGDPDDDYDYDCNEEEEEEEEEDGENLDAMRQVENEKSRKAKELKKPAMEFQPDFDLGKSRYDSVGGKEQCKERLNENKKEKKEEVFEENELNEPPPLNPKQRSFKNVPRPNLDIEKDEDDVFEEEGDHEPKAEAQGQRQGHGQRHGQHQCESHKFGSVNASNRSGGRGALKDASRRQQVVQNNQSRMYDRMRRVKKQEAEGTYGNDLQQRKQRKARSHLNRHPASAPPE